MVDPNTSRMAVAQSLITPLNEQGRSSHAQLLPCEEEVAAALVALGEDVTALRIEQVRAQVSLPGETKAVEMSLDLMTRVDAARRAVDDLDEPTISSAKCDVVANYREEQIRENFGSPAEFLSMMEP